MFTHSCIRCSQEFISEIEAPKGCRSCHSKLWNTPRRNRGGQGRKRKGYVKIETMDEVDSRIEIK